MLGALAQDAVLASRLRSVLSTIAAPKAVVIHGDGADATVVDVASSNGLSPSMHAAAVVQRIRSGHFVGKADRENVVGMFRNYWRYTRNTLRASYLLAKGKDGVFGGVKEDFSLVEGEFDAHGRLQGYGKLVYVNGDSYEGHLYNGVRHGKGVQRWGNGDVYDGEFVNGYPCGHCTYTYDDSSTYVGEWEGDGPHGRGKKTAHDGAIYNGEFVGGIEEGVGTLEINDGAVKYVGEWAGGMREGRGTWTDVRYHERYEGEWHAGLQHGQGTYAFVNGATYTGEWQLGHITGRGVLIDPDGDTYDGELRDMTRHGVGTYTTADGQTVLSGLWQEGNLIERQADVRQSSSSDPPPGLRCDEQ